MSLTVLCGGFWGDEGKGKVAAYVSTHRHPKIVARAGVGTNAGHTVFCGGQKLVLRQLPVGVLEPGARLLVGAGVLVDPEVLEDEIARLTIDPERIGIDPGCALIDPEHRAEDRADKHLYEVVGSTGSGCGPANAARARRSARLARDEPRLAPFITDVAAEVNAMLDRGEDVLVEGTQGFGLSLYFGSYPFVTSKDTTASSMCADVGVGPTRVDDVLVVFKAYASRVGEGPMPTQLADDEVVRRQWEEFGAVTGRRRRIGEFDFELARRAVMLNGATQLALTNVDRRFPAAGGVRSLTGLPADARGFVDDVEGRLGVPIAYISTGADVEDMIDLRQ